MALISTIVLLYLVIVLMPVHAVVAGRLWSEKPDKQYFNGVNKTCLLMKIYIDYFFDNNNQELWGDGHYLFVCLFKGYIPCLSHVKANVQGS